MAAELLMRNLTEVRPAGVRIRETAGGSRLGLALVLAFSVGAAAASASETVDVEVVLDIKDQQGGALPGETTVYAADPTTREPIFSYAVEPASQDERLVLPLPPQQAGWLLWARAPGWWGPARYVAAERRTASLVLAPQGVVRFALDGVDRAVEQLRPGAVWIAGRVDGGSRGWKRGVYGGPCSVDRESNRRVVLVSCPFALGARADLHVRLGPFLPLLRSEVTVSDDTDLGLIEPVRGAAVTGHLASRDGSARVLGLRQRRAPMAFPRSAWTDSGGAFRFEGLSPGTYELRLTGTGDSWPVRVESLVDSVDLGSLTSSEGSVLEVTLGGSLGSEPDRFRPVVRKVKSGVGDEVESRGRHYDLDARNADGSFVWRGLPVGDYELDVVDDRGNRWLRKVLRFHGRDRHYVELDAVPLVGRIERGGEPLGNAMVWFGGLWGSERVSFRSGTEGRFDGLLPREGHWSVEVTPLPACDPCDGGWDTDGWEGFNGLEVDDAGGVEVAADVDGVARVLIDLPGGSVSGSVSWRNVDTGAIEPVEGAFVWVSSESSLLSDPDDVLPPLHWRRATDAAGRFEIGGLPEGVYFVWADAWLGGRKYQSREDRFRVTQGDSTDDLDLWLEQRRSLPVTVRFGGAPAVGAQTFVRDPADSREIRSNSRTDGSGTAVHWLPEAAAVVDVVVRAEGLGMVGWRFDVKGGAPVVVEMQSHRGTLRVPNKWQASLVTPGGVTMPVFVLEGINDYGQVLAEDDEFVIRDLAPGTWMWCSSPGVCSGVDVLPWAETSISQ